MDNMIKQVAGLGQKDWYYLENKIRSHIHDLMQPYVLQINVAKDNVREFREHINGSISTIEDL